ncbi:hypothetical protein M8J77_000525 [Diaphorina citri]|nr:hypothetical protein M8J77_000525 [Diaphorina citri]
MDTRSGFDLIRLEFRPSPWTFSRKLMMMMAVLLLTVDAVDWEDWDDAENATHRMLWTGKNFKEITYHEQIEIHKSVESGKNINEIVDTVPYLVYRRAREQLMPNDGTVPPPPTDHCQQ